MRAEVNSPQNNTFQASQVSGCVRLGSGACTVRYLNKCTYTTVQCGIYGKQPEFQA